VLHDLINMSFSPQAKFVRRYGDAAALITDAVHHYRADVQGRTFPSEEESYHLGKEALAALLQEESTTRRKA
jgi:3-methyl-2-oxobutanoate hydroxymethyltransferase